MIDSHDVMCDKCEPIVCHNNCAGAQDKVTYGFVFIRFFTSLYTVEGGDYAR